MAQYSMVWGGTTVGDAAAAAYNAPYTDDSFSDMLGMVLTYDRTAQGVINTLWAGYTGNLAVTTPDSAASPVALSIATGIALVDGKLYLNTEAYDVLSAARGGGTLYYRVVLRKSFAAQTVRLALIGGGGAAPALTQTDGVTWEISLALITVPTGAGAATITDERDYVGGGGGSWFRMSNDAIQADTGGNARGAYAIDAQQDRVLATEIASGDNSFIAGGMRNTASGPRAYAEGRQTEASGSAAHSEGYLTNATGDYAHAEGDNCTASGEASHAEGMDTVADDFYAHAEGYNTDSTGSASHAEGQLTTASGSRSHAEGLSSTASGADSHAEGDTTVASGANAHAEGYASEASGANSHAEGNATDATGAEAHAEGNTTDATGDYSHAEGLSAAASGAGSHAEGYGSQAIGDFSHAMGVGARARRRAQFALSSYDSGMYDYQFAINHLNTVATHDSDAWSDIPISNNGGTSQTRMEVAADAAWTVLVHITGVTVSAAKVWSYEVRGVVSNNSGIAILYQNTVVLYESDSDFDARLAVDAANDALKVQVRDATSGGDTVNWSATVQMTMSQRS